MEQPLNCVLKRLHGLAARADAELTDRQLLERFAQDRDEASFARLVRRHGPMVLGVCRRTLHDEHDAEDVFQAAFLVLARKAGSVRWRESVGGWLHTITRRLALRARRLREKRQRLEALAALTPSTVVPPCGADDGLRALLDEELGRLPEHHRTVVLLCCVEGCTQSEAARHLGCTPGQVRGYLDRARSLLRRRLARRGLEVSAGVLGAALISSAAHAKPAAITVQMAARFAAGEALAGLVSPQVATLTLGGLTMFSAAKMHALVAVVLVVALAGGTAPFWAPAHGQSPGQPAREAPARAAAKRAALDIEVPQPRPAADSVWFELAVEDPARALGVETKTAPPPTPPFVSEYVRAVRGHLAGPTAVDPLLRHEDPEIRDLAAKLKEKLVQHQRQVESGPMLDLRGKLLQNDPADSVRKGPAQRHTVHLRKGRTYVIDMTSSDFDAYLRLEDAAGKELAHDDDSGGALNARISFTPSQEGNYQVIATSLDGRPGSFHLVVRDTSGIDDQVIRHWNLQSGVALPTPLPLGRIVTVTPPASAKKAGPTVPATIESAPLAAPATPPPGYEEQLRRLEQEVQELRSRLLPKERSSIPPSK